MEVGAVVGGRFVLDAAIGVGGMGNVFRARDLQAGGPVAIKVLRYDDPADVERFLREAEVLSSLSHPGIVRYVAHGTSADRSLYLAMEWIDGGTLLERLIGDGLSLAEAVLVARQAAEALGEAHDRGMVHRDVKPSNVLFAGGDLGRLKLIDFGVARRVRDEGSLTNTGTAMGTPGYMAPEQARGSKRLDARADVFALGCLLYECLTGRPAFSGEHEVAVMAKIVLAEVPELRDDCPEAPEALAELLRSMLDKDPARRAADGRAVARALGALGPLPEAPRRSRRMLLDAPTRRVGAGAAAPTTAQSVVLAANLSPTQEELEDALLASLRALAASHQATLEVLADGSVIANLDGEAPVEVATRAARLGLALRALLADRALVIATSRREAPVLGDAIDRGTRILGKAALESIFSSVVGDRPQGVRLDEVTSGLLDAQRFEVARAAGASYLVGERASP